VVEKLLFDQERWFMASGYDLVSRLFGKKSKI